MSWPPGLLVLLQLTAVEAFNLALVDGNSSILTVCQAAINSGVAAGVCTTDQVQVRNVAACSNSDPGEGTASVVDMYYKGTVDAFVTSVCPDETSDIARLAYFFKKPTLVRIITSATTLDVNIYPNVVSYATATPAGIGMALAALANQLNVSEVSLVTPEATSAAEMRLSDILWAYYQINPVLRIHSSVELDESKLSLDMQISVKDTTKLIAIMPDFNNVFNVLNTLQVGDVSNEGYVVVLICVVTVSACISDTGSVQNNKVVVLAPQDLSYDNRTQVFQTILGSQYQTKYYDQYLTAYQACYGYCYGATKNGNNGDSYSSAFEYTVINNPLGQALFDGGSSIMMPYVTLDYSSGTPTAVLVVNPTPTTCTAGTCFTQNFSLVDDTFWTAKRSVTVDIASLTAPRNNTVWIVIGVVGGLAVIAIAIFIYWNQRRKRLNIYKMHWRITKDNFKIIEAPKGKGRGGGAKENKRGGGVYALVGAVKAEIVPLRHLRKIKFSKDDLRFLLELKRLNHENLATMIGVNFNEGPTFYALSVLIERATLEEMIMNVEFEMDQTFKSAFIRDILRGLTYLHKSPVGYHGLLNCQTCMIDANWVLKLTHFGFTTMFHHLVADGALEVPEPLNFSTYFAIAPEYLRDLEFPRQYPRGSQTGDIYSLGIVIYEIVERRTAFEPFGLQKDILVKIAREGKKPDMAEMVHNPLRDTLSKCYDRDVTKRPSLKEVTNVVNQAFAATQGNLIDQMIRMNEKYAQNLEGIVAQRNASLHEAQEQTDRLLMEMLPPSVANVLKSGGVIPPRNFEAATVLFCQLVNFNELLAASSPDQTIAFLNDVFTRFDDIIKQHDAYKVETTGETYMVASGVPSENEGKHVYEIADIALEIRENSYFYRVAYLPSYKVSVRIGFHCGPIAAGVIGIKSPRYCLFGDTVNFASRMQSNCPPNQIQTSEITADMLMKNTEYKLVKRGIVQVKGKGEVNCFWLNEHIHGEHGIVKHTEVITVGERPSTRSLRRPSTQLRKRLSDE